MKNVNEMEKKIMKKVNKILILTITVMLFIFPFSKAYQNSGESLKAQKCLESFCEYINYGSDVVFNYIDTSNTELYNNVDSYLHALNLNYEIKEIKEENNTYNIKSSF